MDLISEENKKKFAPLKEFFDIKQSTNGYSQGVSLMAQIFSELKSFISYS